MFNEHGTSTGCCATCWGYRLIPALLGFLTDRSADKGVSRLLGAITDIKPFVQLIANVIRATKEM